MKFYKNSKILIVILKNLLKLKVFKKKLPVVGGLILNEKCNLNCLQCRVANRKNIPDLTFNEVEKGLKKLYQKGIRLLYIEGGEPFLWKDGKQNLQDCIDCAKNLGFLWISVYTNGTFPLDIECDVLYVSLDGLKKTNNYLRSKGKNTYDRVIRNIQKSNHKNIIINYTINKINKFELEKFCKQMKKIKKVKGIFFNFHTPYYGVDKLFIKQSEKNLIIDQIINLKKKKYKILNSFNGLKSIKENNWERPSSLCLLFANNKFFKCCRAIGNNKICKQCGYLMYAEIDNIYNLKFGSIFEAFNYLRK